MGKTLFVAIFKIVLECELTAVRTLLCSFLVTNGCNKPPCSAVWTARELQTAPGEFVIQHCVKIHSENSGLQNFLTKISLCIKLAGRNRHAVYFVIL